MEDTGEFTKEEQTKAAKQEAVGAATEKAIAGDPEHKEELMTLGKTASDTLRREGSLRGNEEDAARAVLEEMARVEQTEQVQN